MKYIDVNQARLAYEVTGKGEPVIFLHGFLAEATGRYYAELKQALSARYQVYALDVRGHGGSARTADNVTLQQCALDIAAFVDALDLSHIRIIGHSMGAHLALAAASAHHGRFLALAIITPAAGKGAPSTEEEVAGFMAARQQPEMLSEFFAGMFVRPGSPQMLATCVNAALLVPDPVAEHWMRVEWPQSDLTKSLQHLDLPVLTVLGSRDVVVPPDQQHQDALQIRGAKVITYEGEGHMLPLERPQAIMREITRFFEDTSSQP